MPNANESKDVPSSSPAYAGWRGELLAQLALSRVPGLTIYQSPSQAPFDFLASTSDGFCFFVEAKAFSSTRQHIREIEAVSELRWRLPSNVMEAAARSHTPVMLFLFDADTGHGRFLRLDDLPANHGGRYLTVRLPVQNTITKENLQQRIEQMRQAHRAAHK